MADLTNTTAQAPAAAEAAPAAPAAPESTSGTPDYAQPMGVDFFQAKLAAFRSAVGAEAPAASETPAQAAEVVTPPPAAAAAPEGAQTPQPAAAEQPSLFLERLAAAEKARDEANARLADLAPKADKSDQLLAALKADPVRFLLDNGLSHEQVQDFLINGPKKVDPAIEQALKDAAEVKSKLEARERADAEAQATQQIAAFKQSQIAPHVTEAAFPLLTAVHGNDAIDAVYNVMNWHHQRGESVSAAQAAAKLEGNLSGVYDRMVAKRQPPQKPAEVVPPAPKQKLRALTNQPGFAGSEAEPAPALDDSQRFNNALELMKRLGAR